MVGLLVVGIVGLLHVLAALLLRAEFRRQIKSLSKAFLLVVCSLQDTTCARGHACAHSAWPAVWARREAMTEHRVLFATHSTETATDTAGSALGADRKTPSLRELLRVVWSGQQPLGSHENNAWLVRAHWVHTCFSLGFVGAGVRGSQPREITVPCNMETWGTRSETSATSSTTHAHDSLGF